MIDESNSFIDQLMSRVGPRNVRTDVDVVDDESHDEALGAQAVRPLAVIMPETTEEVADVVRTCADHLVPVTARGSGTGLSGACIPVEGGIVVSFERMNGDHRDRSRQPRRRGATRRDPRPARPGARGRIGLVYPVFPGESSTPRRQRRDQRGRHARGEVRRDPPPGARARGRARHRRGDPHRRQVREGHDRLRPHAAHRRVGGNARARDRSDAPALSRGPSPWRDRARAVPDPRRRDRRRARRSSRAGSAPSLVEYIDFITMDAIRDEYRRRARRPRDVKEQALAYLVVVLEDRRDDRLDENTEELATCSPTSARSTSTCCRRPRAPS